MYYCRYSRHCQCGEHEQTECYYWTGVVFGHEEDDAATDCYDGYLGERAIALAIGDVFEVGKRERERKLTKA